MCRVRSADVQLTTHITLPQWAPPTDAPPELVALWDAFIRALSLHEARHADNAAAAARAVRRELEATSAPSCGMMEGRTSMAASRGLAEHRDRDRAYDERTRHGTTEGAVWPPRAVEVPPP
jgi:predicted secreted Zn-dependent protease